MKFLDEAKICLKSGDGGSGAVSFRREKHVEFGGPDGGDGGRGGDIVLACVEGLNTLIDFRYRQHFRARTGMPGGGNQRSGASASDIVINLPPGTEVLAEDRKTVLADLTRPGERMVLLPGGIGGRGNARFKSSTNRAPRVAEPGRPGEEMWVWLRLKLIADIGMVGLPNAGKSTLLSVVTRAHPKIADYPFTTLHPHLGKVERDEDGFVLADLPGLIKGAHQGTGLGDRFLGHAERCAALLHLVDGTTGDPAADFMTVRHEIESYGHDLAARTVVPVLTKIDAVGDRDRQHAMRQLSDSAGCNAHAVSAVTGEGVPDLLRLLAGLVRQRRNG